MASIKMVMALTYISLLSHYVYSQECKSMSFSNKMTFVNCIDLPTFKAALHWTYDKPKSTLSMAFTVPSTNDGWAAWALNPTGIGMVGAQAIVGFRPKPGASVALDTLDIQSYHSILPGPISYNVTGLSGEQTSNRITLFGTWVIPGGSVVNTVWQVGKVSDGKPNKHVMQPDNFSSKKQIDLANAIEIDSSIVPSMAPAPWTVESVNKTSASVMNVVSIFSVMGVLLAYLF